MQKEHFDLHLLLESNPELGVHHLLLELVKTLLDPLLLSSHLGSSFLLCHLTRTLQSLQVLENSITTRCLFLLSELHHFRVLYSKSLIRPELLVMATDGVDFLIRYVNVHHVVDDENAVGK